MRELRHSEAILCDAQKGKQSKEEQGLSPAAKVQALENDATGDTGESSLRIKTPSNSVEKQVNLVKLHINIKPRE